MTDAELSARLRGNLLAFKTLQARHGPLRLRELPGVTVDVRPAPGDKGTELAVTGDDHMLIRRTLRDTKALLEVGEIAQPVAEGSAESTLLNAPLRAATAHAKEGGRL